METKTNSQDTLRQKRTLLAFAKKYMRNDRFEQPKAARKRALLCGLLSGEIAPEEFKERVKENGLPTRVLSLKEEWQKDLEFHGSSYEVFIGGGKYTFKELLDRFEEFAPLMAEQKAISGIVIFPLDPNSVIGKVTAENRPEEERKRIWDEFCDRWGTSNTNE